MSDNKDPGDKLLSALTTITSSPGATQKKPRKSAFSILLAIFLVSGGVIFMLSIFRGLGDLQNMEKLSFTYDFSARSAALPLFQYFGLAEENEPKVVRGRCRPDAAPTNTPAPDISDWMAKGGTGAASAAQGVTGSPEAAKGFSANPARNTPIPQMASKPLGLGTGGGASQSSAGAPKSSGSLGQPPAGMPKSQASSEVTTSDVRKSAPAAAPAGGKLVGALASVKGAMISSVKSDSAMTARTEWNQAFGEGSGAAGGGTSKEMAYAGGSGLMKLDGIKGGIGDLKTSDMRSLKSVTPPKPTKDKEAESKDSFLNAMKGLGGAGGAEQGKENAEEATRQTGKLKARDPETGAMIAEVPPEVIEKAYKPVSEGGLYCGSGQCENAAGKAIDKEVRITPTETPGEFKVEYIGDQTDYKGNAVSYNDGYVLNSASGEMKPAGSTASCNGGPKKQVEQGGVPPECPIETR